MLNNLNKNKVFSFNNTQTNTQYNNNNNMTKNKNHKSKITVKYKQLLEIYHYFKQYKYPILENSRLSQLDSYKDLSSYIVKNNKHIGIYSETYFWSMAYIKHILIKILYETKKKIIIFSSSSDFSYKKIRSIFRKTKKDKSSKNHEEFLQEEEFDRRVVIINIFSYIEIVKYLKVFSEEYIRHSNERIYILLPFLFFSYYGIGSNTKTNYLIGKEAIANNIFINENYEEYNFDIRMINNQVIKIVFCSRIGVYERVDYTIIDRVYFRYADIYNGSFGYFYDDDKMVIVSIPFKF